MTYIRLVMAPGLLVRAQTALGMTQETLGALLGVSRKTMGRWQAGHGNPTIQQWAQIAARVHAVNPALAATIAAEMGEDLASLGIAASSPQQAPALPAGTHARQAVTTGDLVDSIVCAAAEAVAATPQYIRPALLAAFDRAASVSLVVDEVRTTLRAGTSGDKGEPKKKKGA
jgi:DNA-binding XRE family transcriptional regulator